MSCAAAKDSNWAKSEARLFQSCQGHHTCPCPMNTKEATNRLLLLVTASLAVAGGGGRTWQDAATGSLHVEPLVQGTLILLAHAYLREFSAKSAEDSD